MPTTGRRIAIAFGSNLGDRRRAILDAAAAVARLVRDFRLSSIVETAPLGPGLQNDPAFLNAAAAGESPLPARELLAALHTIEATAGRERSYLGAPRTLDIDLILAGDDIIDEPGLQVPHPRFRDRLFVLEPLTEIAPDLRDPVTGLTMRELLERKRPEHKPRP